MKTKFIKSIIKYLRKIGLGLMIDKLIYIYQYLNNALSNFQFIRNNPNLSLPPSYMLFESFKLNYNRYFYGGLEAANWITNLFKDYIDLKTPIKILDWGCGPSRIIRHFPQILHPDSEIIGSDYNENTIAWNSKNIVGVTFTRNHLAPLLNFDDYYFDAIYSISVFTHLSTELFRSWMEELHRVLKPNGILLITLQGNAFDIKLEEIEKESIREGNPVVRKSNLEGHRSYSAFHPSEYVMSQIKDLFKVERTIYGQVINDIAQQDTWIFKKID